MLIIEKQNISEWLDGLTKKMPVFAPVRREINGAEESVFGEFKPETKIDFDYLPTVRSIKEFFLPEKENIFVFDKRRNKIAESPAPKKFALFGLNGRDIEALAQLDEIMAKPDQDFFYFQKRSAATIIGLLRESEKTVSGCDLILSKINQGQYEIIVLTEKGRKLVKNKLFKNEPAIITSGGSKSDEIMPQLSELLKDPELLADSVKWSWRQDYAIWEELGNLCLGCGICTYICPLCYCFSSEDSVGLDNNQCIRARQWDACTLPRFAQISGGCNFHKTIKERYYNWYYHKFVRAYEEYGKSQCVACGRCQKYCPAKIDIEKYLIRIVENYKKSRQ